MSEEQIKHSEHNCSCKKVLVLVLVTLMFSVATFALTLLNTLLATQGTAPRAVGGEAPNAPVQAPQDKDAVVISKQYDKGQSFAKAKATKKPMVVFFYTDWCGFCQRFAPTFHKAVTSKDIKKNFAVAYVNCDLPESRSTMEEFKVQAFPTVFVIDAKGKKTQLENGTFFTDDAEKNLPVDMMKLLK